MVLRRGFAFYLRYFDFYQRARGVVSSAGHRPGQPSRAGVVGRPFDCNGGAICAFVQASKTLSLEGDLRLQFVNSSSVRFSALYFQQLLQVRFWLVSLRFLAILYFQQFRKLRFRFVSVIFVFNFDTQSFVFNEIGSFVFEK